MRRSIDSPAYELSLDLTAQELLGLPQSTHLVEIDDIRDVDPLLHDTSAAANMEMTGSDDSVEIELTGEQVLALLDEQLV